MTHYSKIAIAVFVSVSALLSSTMALADGPGGSGPGGPDDNRHGRPPIENHRGHGASHQFSYQGQTFERGHRIPNHYRDDRYRVNDWNNRGLPAPPSGQHWAYVNGNYVLIAATTGIITSIILNGLSTR